MKIKRFWVARDSDGDLYLYDHRPILDKDEGSFFGYGFWELSNELFPSLTFENSPKEVCFINKENDIIEVTLLDTNKE